MMDQSVERVLKFPRKMHSFGSDDVGLEGVREQLGDR